MISSANEGLQTSTPPLPSSDLITPSLIFSKIFHRYSHTLNPNPFFPFCSTQAQPCFLQLFNNSSLSHYFIKKHYHVCSLSKVYLFAPRKDFIVSLLEERRSILKREVSNNWHWFDIYGSWIKRPYKRNKILPLRLSHITSSKNDIYLKTQHLHISLVLIGISPSIFLMRPYATSDIKET